MLSALAAVTVGCRLADAPRASHPAASVEPAAPPPPTWAELETSIGGRVGVYAVDHDSGRDLAHRADERFAMCSTFKWALAAAVLAQVDRGALTLSRELTFSEADLLEYAPVTRERLAEGHMTVEALAAAAVTLSDNTAANLLLGLVDGPAGLTRFLREHGDDVTRLDRDEPTLNTNIQDDPRDTTTPRAMANTLRALLLGDALSADSRQRLIGWMEGCRTCAERMRAGLPPGWRAADKTGSGNRGAVNDVGLVWPPAGGPIVIASYLSDSDAQLAPLAAAHAAVARVVVRDLGPPMR